MSGRHGARTTHRTSRRHGLRRITSESGRTRLWHTNGRRSGDRRHHGRLYRSRLNDWRWSRRRCSLLGFEQLLYVHDVRHVLTWP